LIKEFLLLDS
jgi:hypothetical protein